MTEEPKDPTEFEVVVRRVDDLDSSFNIFTEEALRSQDGRTVPLTLEVGGPVVGEATMKYVPEERALKTRFRVDDPKVAKLLGEDPPFIFG